MRKKFIVSMAAALTVLLAGCGSSGTEEDTKAVSSEQTAQESDSESEKESTSAEVIDLSEVTFLNDGVLTVGMEVGYPPFEDFAEDGVTPVGFDVDIITEVADRLGLEVNFINTSWDGVFEGLGVNYDCICSAVTMDAKRKKEMLFSTPYINNYQSVVIPADSTLEISSFADLDGMTVALQKSSTSDELISDYKSTGTIDIEIVANEKVTSCFTQLSNGEVDVVVADSTVVDGYLNTEGDKYKVAFTDDSEPEQFGIAIELGNTALQEVINEALAQMDEDGFIDDTYEYWFGAAAE